MTSSKILKLPNNEYGFVPIYDKPDSEQAFFDEMLLDYRVTLSGKVFSLKRNKFIKPVKHKESGELFVSLCLNSYVSKIQLKAVISRTFLGRRPNSLVTRHKDGNRLNCAADNLKYCIFI